MNFVFQFLMRVENSYKSSRKWCQSFQTLNSHCFRMEIITEESLLTGHPLQNSHWGWHVAKPSRLIWIKKYLRSWTRWRGRSWKWKVFNSQHSSNAIWKKYPSKACSFLRYGTKTRNKTEMYLDLCFDVNCLCKPLKTFHLCEICQLRINLGISKHILLRFTIFFQDFSKTLIFFAP